MEIWDAYDEYGNLVEGVTLVRGERMPEGVYHLVCDVAVEHADGTYLAMQRAANKRFGGLWEVTAGGSALRGEAPEDCAKRELREETGIAADELEWKARTVNPQNHTIYYEYYCKTDCDKQAVTLQEGETAAYRWVDWNTLREMKAQGLLTERSKKFVSAALWTE